MRTIFVGTDGVRAGWRLLIFFALCVATGIVFAVVIRTALAIGGASFHQPGLALLHSTNVPPLLLALAEAIAFAIVYLAAWMMSRIERRPVGAYGLPRAAAFGPAFWEGASIGFAAVTLAIGAMFLSGVFHVHGLRESGPALAFDALAWALAFLGVALAEEFFFRGYVQFTLTCGTNFIVASLLTSALFATAHGYNAGETAIGLVQLIGFALFDCFALWRTGNLWFGVGLHAAWDWAQTYFYGTPDSGMLTHHALLASTASGPAWLGGASAGPEGSVFGIVVLAVAAAYVGFRFAGRPPYRSHGYGEITNPIGPASAVSVPPSTNRGI